jgi:hypothetical protein
MTRERSLSGQVSSALLWIAAFCFACGLFFCATLLTRNLPPTAPVAVGVVTIERDSKLNDYVNAALFFLLVPPLTLAFRRLGERATAPYGLRDRNLFALPYFFAPLLFLTTGKVGWALLLPVVLSFGIPRILALAGSRRWIRRLLRRGMWPFHALIVTEAAGWIFFRAIVTQRRIAHIPTLFLEVVFVTLFVALFWLVVLFAARVAQLSFGVDFEETFARIAVAGLPLALLPVAPIIAVPLPLPAVWIGIALLAVLFLLLRIRHAPRRETAWKLAAYFVLPLLVYCLSYASTAHLSQYVDLFHRGESIGPASDYLRGKAPYRGIYPLHGMLEDGLLDTWLMELFGRSIDVSIAKSVILGGFLALSLWYLGIALFESIPLALLVVAMGAWTTAENERTFFQVAAVALFWYGLKRRNTLGILLAGALSSVALFFSYEIGMYSITGGLAAIALLAIAAARPRRLPEGERAGPEARYGRIALAFLAGVVLGAAPFLTYLAADNLAGDFFRVSFVEIPRYIDAIWSLPFPDLVSTFRNDLNLHSLSDFILFEKFHLILSPLVIAIAVVYCIQRWLRRRLDSDDRALFVLAVFAAVTQRTAFGRAEFRHQYFAAFLLGPMIVMLTVLLARRLKALWIGGAVGEESISASDPRSATRAFILLLIAAAIPLVAVLFWIPDLVNARIDDTLRYAVRTLRVYHEPQADQVTDRINAVVAEVRALVPKRNEPIFDFSDQPALYFFCDRPNPTRFYQVPMMSPRPYQAEVIAQLERAKPKVVLRRSPEGFDTFDGVPNTVRAQAVAAYLDDCYEFYKSVRGLELWRRRKETKPAPLAAYLRLIHVPGTHELANPGFTRAVFPIVGSGEGMGGAYWQSDLTVHNPLRQTIHLNLRYVAADKRIDRRVILAPLQTLRWDDAVKRYFHAESTIGTLWLEYVNTRVPVVTVRSWDSAHQAHASVESPLTLSDSATYGSPTPELVIVGLPSLSSGARHLNVGVVDVGNVPVNVKITVRRASNGAVVGKPIESWIDEDQVFITRDVEAALGFRIDETMVVHIAVNQGTAVGFATVVGQEGDTEFVAAVPAQAK